MNRTSCVLNGHPNGHPLSAIGQRHSNGATDTPDVSPGHSNGQGNGHNGHPMATDTTHPLKGVGCPATAPRSTTR